MPSTPEPSIPDEGVRGEGITAALRTGPGFVAILLAVTATGWWWTIERMRGMDAGPWTGLGSFRWFLGVWVVMMAAMMFPSIVPTVALYARVTRQRSVLAQLLFAAGYLVTWAGAGLLALGLAAAGGPAVGNLLAWDRAGRWVAAATVLLAAAYEVTPFKHACLGRCRSPLGPRCGARRGTWGALRTGAENGAWCVGCCWALMAALFALGVMSVPWMAFVAVLITAEKTLPWRRAATYGSAGILLVVGVLLLTAPASIPALRIPSGHMMTQMNGMTGTG
jgi:predicted metal-binding membrane protein